MSKKVQAELISQVFQELQENPHLLDDHPDARLAVKRMVVTSGMVARNGASHEENRAAKALAIAVAENRKAKGLFRYYSDVIPEIEEAIRRDSTISKEYPEETIKNWIRPVAPESAKKQGRRKAE